MAHPMRAILALFLQEGPRDPTPRRRALLWLASGVILCLPAVSKAQALLRTEVATTRTSRTPINEQYAIAAAVGRDIAVLGVEPNYDSGIAGSVAILQLQLGTWIEETEVVPSSVSPFDHFGTAVATDGNVIVVGAWQADYKGAAFVFRRDASGAWQEERRLKASNRVLYDHYGQAVAVDADVIVVGAPDRNVSSLNVGAAYIYRFDGIDWVEEAYLPSPIISQDLRFGDSVAVHGDRVVIGGPAYAGAFSGPGHAFVYHYEEGVWQLEAELFPGYDQENFGYSVDIEGNRIVIADYHDSYLSHVGKVHVYRRSGVEWLEEQRLSPGDVDTAWGYAMRVAISGNNVVVTAPGGNGCPGDPKCTVGKAYVYRWDGGWHEVLQLLGSTLTRENFGTVGRALGLDGNRVVLGAPQYRETGDQTYGAGFIFNVGELSLLALPGAPAPGERLSLRLDGGEPDEVAFLSIRPAGAPGSDELHAVPVGLFSSTLRFDLSLPVLPVHAGLELECRGFGISALGNFVSSNLQVVHVQEG